MSVIDEILIANKGRRLQSIAVLAHGLMVGDKETMKLGYSRETALSAAIEAMSLITRDERETLDGLLDARLQVEPVSYGPGTR